MSKKVIEFLKAKPGYLKTSNEKLAQLLGCSEKDAKNAKKAIKSELNNLTVEPVKKSNIKVSAEKSAGTPKFRRLFWDIETSPNMVFSWNVGNKISISHDSIIQERAIICICWKWADESKVHSLSWDNGDDKAMILEFMKVLESADESIGHNSDSFDLKWLKARCIYHNIPAFPSYQTLDTLKLARAGFRFNSNRLDYLGRFLGFGGKADTGGFGTWKAIVLNNDEKAMNTMVKYCKMDVVRLEQIYNRLNPYTTARTHIGVILGKPKCSCPNCGSESSQSRGIMTSATGLQKNRRSCNNCGKYFTLALPKV